MILTIDTLAERYKLLPSEVMNRGSTFDLYIMDAAMSYHNHQHSKNMKEVNPNDYSTDELLDMMKKVKNV